MIAKQHRIIAMRILRSSGKTEECYMEKRIQEEEEIKNNMQEVESIGTSLGSLLSGFKLD
mgnify:CR=1 FL=1